MITRAILDGIKKRFQDDYSVSSSVYEDVQELIKSLDDILEEAKCAEDGGDFVTWIIDNLDEQE